MPSLADADNFATVKVALDVLLDSRLALYHQTQRWLAVADLHFGYELRQRAQGGLFPLWGMDEMEARLLGLLQTYSPSRLILCGDIMDFHGSHAETLGLIRRLRRQLPVICILGNHDRPPLRQSGDFVEFHREEEFLFHHGHRFGRVSGQCPSDLSSIHITGHFHPAHTLTDGAGLRLKLPAFVQEYRAPVADAALESGASEDSPRHGLEEPPQSSHAADAFQHWILPAFSPWAGGGRPRQYSGKQRVYPIHPQRILRMPLGAS